MSYEGSRGASRGPTTQSTGTAADACVGKRTLTMDLPSAAALQMKRGSGDDGAAQTPSAPSGGGQPLAAGVRTKMETSFGADFSEVRVHEGAHASAMGALGYTQGTNVHFAPGQYQPETKGGQELLGHELAHVVQQSQGRVQATTQAKGASINDDSSLEREADDMGGRAARGEPASEAAGARPVNTGAAVVQHKVIQRQEMPKGSDTPSGSVGHKTGKEVDSYLTASAALKKYIEPKFKAGTKAEGHVHFLNAADYETAAVIYGSKRLNPGTGKVFTADEAKAFFKATEAFRDGSEMYVNQGKGEPATVLHEAIHLFCDTRFRDKYKFNVNEGTTAYFSRLVSAEQKIPLEQQTPDERKAVEKLIGVVGQDKLADAYFNGKLTEMEAALDTAKGAGTFTKWLDFMQKAKYPDANALL